MVKKNLQDEELIELFQQFPEITDHRNMDEIYFNVMDRLKQTKHRRKRRFIIPAFATAALLFLSGILIMSMGRFSTGDLSFDNRSGDVHSEAVEFSSERQLFESDALKDKSVEDQVESTSVKSALYESMIGENEVPITLYIPDTNIQNMIPVTVLVTKSADQSAFDAFLQVYDSIDEQALGLTDYYPYDGTLSIDEDGYVALDLSSEAVGNWGSTGEITFMKSIESLQSLNIDFVYLFQDGSPGLYFPHTGLKIFKYELGENEQKQAYYIYQTETHMFLTNGPDSYEDISQALVEMKENVETYDLKRSIPEEMEFSVKQDEDGLITIQFSNEPTDLEPLTIETMIEAILLTAKSFDYTKVKFENLSVEENIGFDLEQPIQVPIAPNLIEFVERSPETGE